MEKRFGKFICLLLCLVVAVQLLPGVALATGSGFGNLQSDGGILLEIDCGSSTFPVQYESGIYQVANIWKAVKAEPGSPEELLLDYTVSLDAAEVAAAHNEKFTEPSYQIGDQNHNDGEIWVEFGVSAAEQFGEETCSIGSSATYGFSEVDLRGYATQNYHQWAGDTDIPFITVTTEGTKLTVQVRATAAQLYQAMQMQGMDFPVDDVYFYVSVGSETSQKVFGYIFQQSFTTLENANLWVLDGHMRETALLEEPKLTHFDNRYIVLDSAPRVDDRFYEPVDWNYQWTYRFSRIGQYDETLGRMLGDPIDTEYEDDAVFLEVYDGVTYGVVSGVFDAGANNTFTIRQIMNEENTPFLRSLCGVPSIGDGGEVFIELDYTMTATYADGEQKVVTGSASNELTALLSICPHSCRVCGRCTAEEKLACNMTAGGDRNNQCGCNNPRPETHSVMLDETWFQVTDDTDLRDWGEEVAVAVEQVYPNADSEYIRGITAHFAYEDLVDVYDISAYDAYGVTYQLNKDGRSGESVTLELYVLEDVAAYCQSGQAKLYRIDKNGNAEQIPYQINNRFLEFSCDSLGTFAVVISQPYYGRQALSQLPNGEALVYAYDQIVEGIENTVANISVDNGVDSLSVEDIHTVWSAYNQDHGGVFWRGNGYSYSYNSSGVTAVLPTYIFTGAELEEKKAEMEAKVAEILAGITPGMGEYEKALYLHDRLAAIVTYVDGPNAHNAYGALVEGNAVCEGYAEAYQYLLQQVGIQSHNIIGSSYNAGTGAYEGHEWTCARIDGKYYHIDVTWDDQGEVLYHAYFGLSDARIQEDHVIEVPAYDLPVCDSGEALYFRGKPELLESYTVASVAELLQDNGGTVHVYIPGNVQTFIDWYYANIYAIATQMGLNGFQSRLQYLGREIVLTLKAPQPAYTPGDINGDDKINNKDASRLFQYLAGWDVEVNEAALDVNGDGKVNNKDASRLFQYLAGWDVEIQ